MHSLTVDFMFVLDIYYVFVKKIFSDIAIDSKIVPSCCLLVVSRRI